ncbi:glycosyl hydrolase family 28-related protein [Tropicibacter naphthalenivorans]|uniref:Pectate lyase superfamily protein n=1 Tax=Tropicibacter naphthalenivorans TaxID=441103 RepID=A0A0P1GGS2_9RHOB|nr:glycosyl hydrolase family 28-related protein [Tropicibacter naphthalenivorans]CUH75368.1 Pectate lyase superfamily protein [Tropicibacter naphthalenivorans]SMC44796.1 Pectate lyase superfamily protein [Tropicibacter naphthalenivorans]
MNKAITDGIVFMPPAFSADTLGQWSRGDGTPGSDTYANLATAAFVPADQDFGGCLEIQKTTSTQTLRYMGQTPLPVGTYLRITARVKATAGALPQVRIAGWAGDAGGNAVTGIPLTATSKSIDAYGEIVEVSAIVGSGQRGGVDMPWGTDPIYGHFGLDLTGANGGVVRIDDIIIEDITSAFLRDMMAWVDVRDFGAVGDGVTDDTDAFEAADAAANGRRVMVSAGTYHLARSLNLTSRVQFEGTLTMPTDAVLDLTKDFSLPNYIDAFGGDEELAFKKAVQSLMNGSDHESLDLGGRRVSVNAPIDVQAAVPNRTSYAQRRVIRNGQLRAEGTTAWEPETTTSMATYSASDPWHLTDVTNIANIQVGSLVEAPGVGREIYVRSVNVSAGEVKLSQPLSDAVGRQTYTFTRFKYMLDFTGFEKLNVFELEGVELQCGTVASGMILPAVGTVNVVRNCVFNRPGHRGITSIGDGCQGMLIDHCQFISHEGGLLTQDRVSVAINTNANDVKIRNCRASQFRHFAVVSGAHTIISGNHFFQGDDSSTGTRSAGLVICLRACNAQVTGNYLDNCFIEWTNEREPEPDYSGGFGFAGLSVTNNVMLSSHVAPWFSHIVVKPYGTGHFINGLNVQGNTFRCVGGSIFRAERVDTSFAQLDKSRMRSVIFDGNTYHNVETGASNPLRVTHSQNTHSSTWEIDTENKLPFEGYALDVEAVTQRSRPRNTANVSKYYNPYALTEQGGQKDKVHLIWGEDLIGDVTVKVRMDN